MAVSDWFTTASSNTTIGSINIAENCPAGNVNNAIREEMAQLRAVLTDAVLSIMGKATVAEILTALGVTAATDATDAISALTPAADKLPYYTGASTASLATLTSFMRTVLDDPDAATARATLGAIGVTSSSLVPNGGYIVRSDGLKETWGYVTVAANSSGSYSLPVAHSSWVVPVLTASVAPGNNGQSENAGLTNVTTSTISLYNAENFSRTFYIHTKGV